MLPFSIKTVVFSIFKWLLKTGFTVIPKREYLKNSGNVVSLRDLL